MGNGVGIIDSDYYNNPDNEGHIYFELINLLPFDIKIKKGDCIGQGILLPYGITEDDQGNDVERTGGLGSTGE
jgi:dUTP pyrophosphatase